MNKCIQYGIAIIGCMLLLYLLLGSRMNREMNEKEQTFKEFTVPPLTEQVIIESDARIAERVENWEGNTTNE